MAFAGTTQKCTACTGTVYLVDRLAANNRIYHKACFRCHHCNGTLKLGNFNSIDGVLYCRPHFDQLFKRTGSLDKSFEDTKNNETGKGRKRGKSFIHPIISCSTRVIAIPNRKQNANKVSSKFGGTKDKCVGCNKTVYPIEKVSVNRAAYHKSCFKCSHGGCTISPSNYIAHEGTLYCKHHHIQLVKAKGNYSQLEIDSENPSSVIDAAQS
ncbi:LIM domain-containing protein wlim1 [Castilleja foliolosa]|uniref:LIM domain-containing protein wlim1 n=1 Tax=Castilleja foliolosa TaxID=1961234 RepID=A0ABD3EBQ2_9LAMI